MIRFEEVSFSYKDSEMPGGRRHVFRNFSLHVKPGERILVQGASGCGTTTLLRLIMGLERPDLGELHIGTGKLSAVFQENRLLPYLTAAENCTLFGPDREAVLSLLARIGLEESADAYPSSLSGGMARRVAIARALTHPADLYLFDEPFTGLDEENVQRTAETICHATEGKTVVLVTHRAEEGQLLGVDRTVEL